MRVLLALLFLLPGCISEPSSLDCGDDVLHPFEARCLDADATYPHNERCQVWDDESEGRDDFLFCTAMTDGRATVVVEHGGQGMVEVNVWQLEQNKLQETVGPGRHVLPVAAAEGQVRLTIGFADASGPVMAEIWG